MSKLRLNIFLSLLIITLSAAQPSWAFATSLQGTPKDTVEIGDSFVMAWLQFRRDLDALSGTNVHPAQFDEWFGRMPEFLLRDVARLATNHEVVIAAARRLAVLGGRENRQFIESIRKRYQNGPLESVFKALLIRAGSQSVRQGTLLRLRSKVAIHQIEAAIVLAAAGQAQGLNTLRNLVRRNDKYSDLAALALGRYGKISDEKHLQKRAAVSSEAPLVVAALGEIALRKYFPFHYKAFLTRNRVLDTHASPTGLYETWLFVSEAAISGGATTAAGFMDALKDFRRPPSKLKTDPELFKRQVAALQEFWVGVNRRLKTPSSPKWPSQYDEAMTAIQTKIKGKRQNGEDMGARVAATITVCSVLGSHLGYPKLALPDDEIHVMTPLGERVLDGNIATSWHAKKGRTLVVERRRAKDLEALLLMISCVEKSTPTPVKITVEGESTAGKHWKKNATLSSSKRYYQIVPLGKRAVKRISIRLSTQRKSTLCISELRLK